MPLSQAEFNQLVTDHGAVLYRIAYRMVGDRQEAEDIVQDTYRSAWKSRQRYKPGLGERAWLTSILRRRVVDRWRKRPLPSLLGGDFTHDVETEGIDPLANDYTDEMQQALNRLPGELRESLLLVVVGELTHQEAANLLSVPLGTVLSRVSRARERLREYWLSASPPHRRTASSLSLPESTTSRSFMTEPEITSDPWLDARLRNVPLPVGLLARLQEIGTAETQQMDRALREVPVPEGLLDRLRSISQTPQRRVDWRELAVHSSELAVNWREFAAHWREFALAASVLLAVGLGYFGFASALLKSGATVAQQDQQPSASDKIAENGDSSQLPSPEDRLRRDRLPFDGQPEAGQIAGDFDAAGSDFANGDLTNGGDMPSSDFDQWKAKIQAIDPLGGTTAQLDPGPSPSLPKVERPTHQNALGARFDGRESLPDLDSVEVRVPQGLTPPRVAGYDLLFQLRYGQHPLVNPAAHQDLRSLRVPLVTSSASYRRAMRDLAEGRLPSAANLRTEEFLAALDYGYPAPSEGTVALQTAGGPSPLGSEGASLLQVAVKAGSLPHEAHEATHLTVVLDTSNSMQHSARWGAVQLALDHLRDPMGPADRITLIGYNDDAEILVDDQGREEAGRLLSALQTVQPRRAANLAAGLSLGCSVMPRASDAANAVRRLVVISGGRVDSTGEAAERVRGRIAELAKAGVTLQVLDLGRDEQASVDLAPWTQAADGRVTRVADPSTLYWNLLEALVGRSPVVAAQTSLRVTFYGDAVAAYRLVGHERSTITGLALAPIEVDLRSGESASGLFEVVLKPTGSRKVATIEVSWQKPGYGKIQHLVQQVTREQFAHSFASSPPTLQAAAVAALTAETLRGSYFAHTTQSLARVIELTKQVGPAVQAQPSFRELTDFIQRAERVRTHRSASSHRNPAAEVQP